MVADVEPVLVAVEEEVKAIPISKVHGHDHRVSIQIVTDSEERQVAATRSLPQPSHHQRTSQ